MSLATVAHPVIPATQEAVIGRMDIGLQPLKKKNKKDIHLSDNKKSWLQWHSPAISATSGSVSRKIEVQAMEAKMLNPI
jgi:hypothetical protein